MSEFQPGEVVNITIEGARVVEVCRHGDGNGDDLRFKYETKGGETWPNAVWADAPGVTVERVAPAEWPPRAGDLWRDLRTDPWFAADTGDPDLDEHVIELIDVGGNPYPPNEASARFGPMTLVHREPEQDGGGSDG